MKKIAIASFILLFAIILIVACSKKKDDVAPPPPPPVNVIKKAPWANAGSDQIMIVGTDTATLKGWGSDPDGSIVSYNWSKFSGPSQYILLDSTLINAKVKGLVKGDYIFELKVTDNDGLFTTDQVALYIKDRDTATGTGVGWWDYR